VRRSRGEGTRRNGPLRSATTVREREGPMQFAGIWCLRFTRSRCADANVKVRATQQGFATLRELCGRRTMKNCVAIPFVTIVAALSGAFTMPAAVAGTATSQQADALVGLIDATRVQHGARPLHRSRLL